VARSLDRCVLGSGPTGVACAAALLARGARVTMIDAGLELERSRRALVDELGRTPPAQWLPDRVAPLKQRDRGAIPLKLAYGSDFPYRDASRHLRLSSDGVGLRPSLALGGLSNVWGAATLPYGDAELADWPVTAEDLSPHFAAALELTGLAGRGDDLAARFPLYAEPGELPISPQGRAVLSALERARGRARSAGISFGAARLAVRGCEHCGLCMYGCPYGHIYNSADTVASWRGRAGFEYEGDSIVTQVHERGAGVVVEGYRRSTGEAFRQDAEQVFLATGVVPTTGILLRSLGAYGRPLTIRDSQYFLAPLLLARCAAAATNTLSDVFLELDDRAISQHTIHLQLYPYNELVAAALPEWLGRHVPAALERRLMILQGYLHSDDSATMTIELDRSGMLRLAARPSRRAGTVVRRVLRRLARNARVLGGVVVSPLVRIGEPGRGFHSGGSLPMRAEPGELETDVLGRPSGFTRVHAVDASVFPSIAAPTITLTAMANAHRIGSAA
jgi:choline dehydrogenase-like flavoprotein